MFSIGEFARLGSVSVRTLRHYDEIGLLHPAKVDPNTGYRSYAADQLGQLNRIMALKDLGFSLEQTRKLISGITLEELRGMLALRRAQLEQELDEYVTRLRGVEARLRYIEGENAMPADDITVKKVPEMGVVAIAGPARGYNPIHVVPVVNRARVQFDELDIAGRAKVNGPFMVFFEDNEPADDDITVFLALPVAEPPPPELPPPARYLVLPAIEAATAVRNGKASSIYPAVYHDLVHWCSANGYQTSGPGRDIWIHEIDDVSQVEEQVFETQLPFTRPEATSD
jgi:DNA-binding transcriptional MerR regulator/effector-binding domain-containing protein